MKHKNILLIGVLPPPINGQTLAFQSLTNELDVKVLTLSGIKAKSFKIKITKILIYLRLLVRLIGIISFKKHLVYHTLSQSKEGFMRDFPIIFISKLFGSKVIGHIHGGNYDGFYRKQNTFFQTLIRKILIQMDSVIVLSENMKKMFDFVPEVYPKIKVVKNGLPFNFEDNSLKFKCLSQKNQEPIKILFLSNLIESKGYLEVLEATEILINRYGYNVQTDFCGDFVHYNDARRFDSLADEKNYFFDFVSKNKLQNHINYHGIVAAEKKVKLLEDAHFFILPTNYINEGQPISIIEAMAYRCVILATRYRGIPEMIKPNESGIYVDFGSPESIALEVQKLIQNPSEFERISANGHQVFQENFTKEKHLTDLINEIKRHV
jgi:glycosyltransferase involved in cell wall biosynthesis